MTGLDLETLTKQGKDQLYKETPSLPPQTTLEGLLLHGLA
jgi:hypothetical protein